MYAIVLRFKHFHSKHVVLLLFSQIICAVIAGLLHFLFLCAFCWMLLEGLQIYRKLVVVFDSAFSWTPVFFAIGYGVPAIIITLCASVNRKVCSENINQRNTNLLISVYLVFFAIISCAYSFTLIKKYFGSGTVILGLQVLMGIFFYSSILGSSI